MLQQIQSDRVEIVFWPREKVRGRDRRRSKDTEGGRKDIGERNTKTLILKFSSMGLDGSIRAKVR